MKTRSKLQRTALGVALIIVALLEIAGCSEPRPDAGAPADGSPPESRFLPANGQTIEVLDWGGLGPNLILIHGAGVSPHYFDDIAVPLRKQFRVVAIARRGHGRSSIPSDTFDVDDLAEDLRQVMDSLRIEQTALLAQSFGGNEITRFAALYPGRVFALVYLDAHYERFESPWLAADVGRPVVPCRQPEIDTIDKYRACMRTYLLPGLEWTSGWEGMIRDMVTDRLGAGLTFKSDTAPVSGSMPRINVNYRREYDLIQAPVLVLMAETFYVGNTSDPQWNEAVREWHEAKFLPAQTWTIERFRRAIPNVEIEIVPETSHLNIIAQNRPALLQRLSEFLSRAAGGREAVSR